MATALNFEGEVAQSVAGVKKKMAEIKMRLQVEEENAVRMESEYAEKSVHLAKMLEDQEEMKYRVEDLMAEVENREKKMIDIEHRVLEREEFVRVSKEAAERVVIVTLDEDEVAAKQQELEEKTETYRQNAEKLKNMEARRKELDSRHEDLEAKHADLERTLHRLKVDLEYNTLEEQRRSKTSAAAVEMAFNTEKSCKDLERGMEVIWKRQGEATRRLNDLELRIHKVDDAYDAVSFERRRIEAAIREILLSSVRKLNQ